MRSSGSRFLFPAAVVLTVLLSPLSLRAASTEALFLELCSTCHTIGEGDGAGPDLLPATRWQRADLRAAVVRMQENTGPLTDAQIDALVGLLQDPQIKHRLARDSAPPPEPPSLLEGASAEEGRRLFFGQTNLANGGSPCFACHAVGGRGGNMAADLTTIYSRRSESALIAATEKAPFPLMRATYLNRPVTTREAKHLTAFFRDSATGAGHSAIVPKEVTTTLFGAAGGFAIVLLGASGLLLRSRRAGVRARMVRNSSGGE